MQLHRYLRNRAIRLTRRVASPMHRWRLAHGPRVLPLEQVRRRLELLLVAMYGTPMHVGPVVTSGENDVGLPPQLDASAGLDDAVARYRLLALAQAARLARRDTSMPPDDDLLARDLHRLAESAAAERELATLVPSLVEPLALLRFAELAGRRRKSGLSHTERRVEAMLAALLASPPDRIPSVIPECATPGESRAWAEATAEQIRRETGGRSPYRPRNPMSYWGLGWSRVAEPTDEPPGPGGGGGSTPDPSAQSRAHQENATRRVRTDDSGDDDASRSHQGDTTDAGDDRNATLVRSSQPGEGADDQPERTPAAPAGAPDAPPDLTLDEKRRGAQRPPSDGIAYPEWDEYGHQLRAHGTTVSCSVAAGGDDTWAAEVLREHASLVRQVRDRFAPLRARRLRLRRQRVGDELDLEACVAALTDRRIGVAPSDRLYQVVRTSRHTMAIMLLVDTSGSTATKLDDGRTVLDVERMTLLLAAEALATLGDPYAMLSFSGTGRHGVNVCTIKEFAERDLTGARRRIAALVPRDNTRLGAAVRHATAVLNTQPAQRRVLIVLSDGQPNDVDWYQGVYAIEDSRRAILDARVSGVHTFCLTVEQEEMDYLPHLFGAAGYRVLSRPEQLPEALMDVVVGMLRS